jgi:hypothetical protein
MKHNPSARLLLVACYTFLLSCNNLSSYGQHILKLEKEIALPGVQGRIDHVDVNVRDHIAYVAALGNNTVEVVDLKKGIVLYSIKGLSEPQGIAYIPKHNEIFVANGGTGECDFYNAATFQKTGSVKYNNDADDVRYDAATDQIYVGYGSGGIGIIDAATHKQIADIKLPVHPESFQPDVKEGRIWVNLPDAGSIGVIDIKQAKLINQWKRFLPRFNFPMAYDAAQHRIMVGYRLPATLKVLDSRTGKEIFSSGMVGDADDLYWDDKSKQIFISGGGGSIDIFRQISGNKYTQVASIKTRSGARTSLFVPELRLFLLAARKSNGLPASLMIYHLSY